MQGDVGSAEVTRAGRVRAVAVRAAGILLVTAAVAGAHAAGAALPACPLRTLTGVPCPACGSTTAGLAVARLDPRAALAASPAALVAALLLVAQPLLRGPVGRWPRRVRFGLLWSFVAAAEAWQLVRLGPL